MEEPLLKPTYEELVARTKEQIARSSDREARARLENVLRDAEFVEAKATKLRMRMKQAEAQMEKVAKEVAIGVRLMPWFIAVVALLIIGIILAKHYL
jgi:hypothetical protein